jgi:hypothetical protein
MDPYQLPTHAWRLPHPGYWRAERVGALFLACGLHSWSKSFIAGACGFGTITQFAADSPTLHLSNDAQIIIDVGTRFAAGVWLKPFFGLELRADAAYILRRGGVRDANSQTWRMAPFTSALRLAFIGVFDVFGTK